jgi:hypothetical protein
MFKSGYTPWVWGESHDIYLFKLHLTSIDSLPLDNGRYKTLRDTEKDHEKELRKQRKNIKKKHLAK